MDKCEYCGRELILIDHSTEPEGMRKDRYCPDCFVQYACHKSGLEKIFDGTKLRNELDLYKYQIPAVFHEFKKLFKTHSTRIEENV